jgi:hypothetical protein
MPTKPTRQYSRDFEIADWNNTRRYLLDGIPAGLWRSVRAKAKAEGRSIRNILLTACAEYLDAPAEDGR